MRGTQKQKVMVNARVSLSTNKREMAFVFGAAVDVVKRFVRGVSLSTLTSKFPVMFLFFVVGVVAPQEVYYASCTSVIACAS